MSDQAFGGGGCWVVNTDKEAASGGGTNGSDVGIKGSQREWTTTDLLNVSSANRISLPLK